jgi:hypothetical protein
MNIEINSSAYLQITQLGLSSGDRLEDWLLKSETPERLNLNHITIAKKMPYSFTANNSYALIVDIGSVRRFEVLAVNQGWEFFLQLIVVHN